jgi:MFS family permease
VNRPGGQGVSVEEVEDSREISFEEIEDSIVDADVPIRTGTALAALRQRTFRIVFVGAFLSNIGTWMQSVILGAYAYSITHSSAFVGLLVFALFGPQLLLAIVGGAIADALDRRLLLIVISVEQLVLSVGLAWLVHGSNPSHLVMILLVVGMGVGQAVYAPAYAATLPNLVDRQNLAGAISLNSAQINASRVIGPAIAGFAYHAVGPSWVFLINAASYLFIVGALLAVRLPRVSRSEHHESGLRNLTAGVRAARTDRVVTRSLVTIALYSLLCLPFIGLMPVVAARAFGLDPRSGGYGVLYACFGIGALLGALSIGTVLVSVSRQRVVRIAMVGFAVSLGAFALVRIPAPAFPLVAVVGAFYFAIVTALSTATQERLADETRGRVMALWLMAFGGTISIGNLLGGPIAGWIGVRPLLLFGSAVALVLAWYADIRPEVSGGRGLGGRKATARH